MKIDVAYSIAADKHFKAGEIVTLKAGGATWGEGEVGENMAKVTLEVSDELFKELNADIGAYRVDDVEKPQAIISGS